MIVALQGGMGNQLFEAAFGLSVAKARNEELFFSRNLVDADSRRTYCLDAFNMDVKFADMGPLRYNEGAFKYDPGVYSAPEKATYVGFWQTEKYFDEPLVRQHLTLRNTPSDASLLLAETIRANPDSAFIHVRRSDYLKEPHASFHGNLSVKYYETAVNRILNSFPNSHFFIFSDDPNWCRANFQGNVFTIVNINSMGTGVIAGHEHEDLWLMSLCHHAIIANSSFGWFGAWMGDQQKNRIVIAPKKWFQNPSMEYSDVIPDRWVKMENA